MIEASKTSAFEYARDERRGGLAGSPPNFRKGTGGDADDGGNGQRRRKGMNMPRREIIRRLLISIGLGLVFAVLLSEVTFILLGAPTRAPRTITIEIPAGTAQLVDRGQQPPSIPSSLIFVAGDVLRVQNDDAVGHKLGPLWIPPGTSGELSLSQIGGLAYECSFQPGKILGLDVREPLTFGTRIYGIVSAGLPLSILIALYVFTMPQKPADE